MNKPYRAMIGLPTFFAGALASQSVVGDAPLGSSSENREQVEAILKKLDASASVDRNQAKLEIESLGDFEIPVIKDLLQHTELTAQSKAAVTAALARMEPRARLSAKKQKRVAEARNWIRQSVLMDAKMHGRNTWWLDVVKKVVDLDAKVADAPSPVR